METLIETGDWILAHIRAGLHSFLFVINLWWFN